MDGEIEEMAQALSNLDALWSHTPSIERRGLGELMLPAGYVCGRIRTAEKGLLLRTFGTSKDGSSYWVRPVGFEPTTLCLRGRYSTN